MLVITTHGYRNEVMTLLKDHLFPDDEVEVEK